MARKKSNKRVAKDTPRQEDDEASGRSVYLITNDCVVPEWMRCEWVRVPCGNTSCPICGVSENRHSVEIVADSLAEAKDLLKKEAEKSGIDIADIDAIPEPPTQEHFPSALFAQELYVAVSTFAEGTNTTSLYDVTEEWADLLWYSGILATKMYRQCCNRWYINEHEGQESFDYGYTKEVLEEVSDILIQSLATLSDSYNEPFAGWHTKALQLKKLALEL